MKLFTRKVRLFCVSNIMVSFVCTGFLGINGFQDNGSSELNAHEISLTSSDTEPASQYGEGEDNYLALITSGIKAVIDQQEDALADEVATEVKEEKKEETKKTSSSKKTTTKKTSTKKTSSKKTTTTKSSSTSKSTTTVTTKKTESKSTTSYAKATGSATGDSIASYAKKFLGLRYRTGVPSLSKGADCSGFTMLIFREYGISLPRTVGGQAKKGSAVSKSNLQKGDLVFFKPKGCKKCGLSHVAIYIGGGQVIHETRPGRGVAITRVDGLSNIQYVTARRVINSKTAKVAEKKVEEQKKTVTDNASKTTETTNTQNNKNEGNVDNNVTNNNVVTATPTAAPVVKTEVKVAATPTPAPTAKPVETKVEVKEEKKVEVKEESKKEESTPVESGQ